MTNSTGFDQLSQDTNTQSSHDLRMERILDFTPEELLVNQQGQVTQRQQQRLGEFRQHMLRDHRQSGIFIVVLILIGTLIAALLGKGELASLGLMVTALLVFTFAASWLMTRMSTKRLLDPKVRMAEGSAHLTIGRGRFGKIYGVKIGKKQFFVTPDHYSAFQEARTYRLYYVDSAPYYLLSAEEL